MPLCLNQQLRNQVNILILGCSLKRWQASAGFISQLNRFLIFVPSPLLVLNMNNIQSVIFTLQRVRELKLTIHTCFRTKFFPVFQEVFTRVVNYLKRGDQERSLPLVPMYILFYRQISVCPCQSKTSLSIFTQKQSLHSKMWCSKTYLES